MEKSKDFRDLKFSSSTIEKAFSFIDKTYRETLPPGHNKEIHIGCRSLNIRFGDVSYRFDNEEEFFAEYRKEPDFVQYRKYIDNTTLYVQLQNSTSSISVDSISRPMIEGVFNIFEDAVATAISLKKIIKPRPVKIFIGHGRDPQWRLLKDHLVEKHGYSIEAYEVGARAGHAVRDILDEMLGSSSLAFLVLTGEDTDENGGVHARENVVHETGLFQGRLGFSRAVVLLEEGTTEFSNIHGIEQVRFGVGKIKETFGDVVAIVRRELG